MTLKHKNFASDLTVSSQQGASESIMSLLKETVLGTPGKLRYKHTQTERNINKHTNLRFIQIKKRNRVLGTAGFIDREISFNDSTLKSHYVRYLSVYNPFKKTTLANSRGRNSEKKHNSLRRNIELTFNRELEKAFKKNNSNGIYYAYVEADNLLSKNLCKSFGFETVRKVNTILFSRFFPKSNNEISRIRKNNFELFTRSLRYFYKDYNFTFTESLEDFGSCFVFKRNGESVAGIRAIPVHWEIVEMPGLKGFLMLKILPKIPLFKRLFKPQKFEFLAFDSLWYKDGHSEKAFDLMNHACSELGYHMGMIWEDRESITSKDLLSKNKLGFLHKINGKVSAHLMARNINLNPEDFSALKDKPAFVSAVDMT